MSALASSEKKTRLKEKDQVQVATGPSSLSPGQWLTDVYIAGLDMADADANSETFQSALAILESYRFGTRIRALRYLVKQEGGEGSLTEFTTEPESVETKSLVYVSIRIEKLPHYLNRAWKRQKITESMKLTRETQRYPSVKSERADDDAASVGVAERHDVAQWKSDGRAVDLAHDYLSEAEINALLLAKNQSFPEDVRVFVALMLQGFTDLQIAKQTEKSRWSIGRLRRETIRDLREAL
jgi:hypothetical protein